MFLEVISYNVTMTKLKKNNNNLDLIVWIHWNLPFQCLRGRCFTAVAWIKIKLDFFFLYRSKKTTFSTLKTIKKCKLCLNLLFKTPRTFI